MSKNLWSVFAKAAIGLVAVFALILVAGVVLGYLSTKGVIADESAEFWVTAVFSTVLMVGAFAVGVAWMRSIDEAAQEAHKAAWYWGGTAGMVVVMVALILSTLPQGEAWIQSELQGDRGPAGYMALGAVGTLGVMTVGYLIVWAWWWLRRR